MAASPAKIYVWISRDRATFWCISRPILSRIDWEIERGRVVAHLSTNLPIWSFYKADSKAIDFSDPITMLMASKMTGSESRQIRSRDRIQTGSSHIRGIKCIQVALNTIVFCGRELIWSPVKYYLRESHMDVVIPERGSRIRVPLKSRLFYNLRPRSQLHYRLPSLSLYKWYEPPTETKSWIISWTEAYHNIDIL